MLKLLRSILLPRPVSNGKHVPSQGTRQPVSKNKGHAGPARPVDRWENYMPGIAVVSSEPAFLHCFGASDRRISYAWLLLRKVDVAAKSALWETTASSTIRSGQP